MLQCASNIKKGLKVIQGKKLLHKRWENKIALKIKKRNRATENGQKIGWKKNI